MLEFASSTGSDDWYLIRLCNQLGEGLPRLGRLRAYRDGDALIPNNVWEGARESYMRFMRRARLHVVETIRDARTNRQRVIGFRTAAAGDESGDTAAWKQWRTSNMGDQSRQFFNDTADYGDGYILTLRKNDGAPLFQVRNGWDTAAEMDPMEPWLVKHAVTVGFDAVAGLEIAVLYGQGWYRVATRRSMVPTLPTDGTPWYTMADWTWASERKYTAYTNRNLIVRNRTVDGFGVYEKHLDTIDRINEITLNGLTLIVTQAFRQRGVEGKLPTHYPEGHPNAGQEIDYNSLFQGGPAALWLLGDAKVWESQPTDVRPIYDARKQEVEVLASLTSTPQYVFSSDSANQSATGAELAREQLVFAVNGMNEKAEVAIAHAQSLAFEITGDAERADVTDIEVMWAKTNPATLAERSEASAKFKAGGATQNWIDEHVLEMTPAERRQAEQDRLTEAFTASLGGETTDASQSGTVTPSR